MSKYFSIILAGLAGGLFALAQPGLAAPPSKPVYDSPQSVQPLKKGQTIPDGILVTLEGKKVSLKGLVAQNPTILIFYRGGWCPYCNAQMGQLVKIEPDLKKLGYQVLAITPDKPESLKASMDKHGINYTLLSDRAMKVTQAFGLAYHVAPDMLKRMKDFGVDLEGSTGNALHELPVPAAYVVDRKGVTHFVYYNPDYKVRVDPDELMKAAKEALKE